jgi:hypothetical protein
MLGVNAPVAGKLRIDLGPFLVDRPEILTLQVDSFAIYLAGVDVNVNVRVIGIAMDSGERHGFREGLAEEIIGQFPNLIVRRRNVERQNHAVMGTSAPGFFELFVRAKIASSVLDLFL